VIDDVPSNELAALAAALRGGPLPDAARQSPDGLLDLAIEHGVGALLARSQAALNFPPTAAARLAAHARERAVVAAIQDREMSRVLEALDARGVRPLVIKGGHLSHALYRTPGLRPRGDTDLLVRERDRDRIGAALATLGYTPLAHVRGSVILGQFHFIRTDPTGVAHALDIHWRIAAPLLFADVLTADVLRSRAVRVTPLGPYAFGPSVADALVLGCIHLIAHRRHYPRLLWLHDLLLLVRALDAAQYAVALETARAAGVTALCAAALEEAARWFDDPSLTAFAAALRADARQRRERSAELLTMKRPVDALMLDMRTSPGWRVRVRLIREHLIPNADYMRVRSGGRWLPLAYARRAIAGARCWLSTDSAARNRDV
jgi:hypothetical protein